jgi:hypothetical protein
MHHPAIPKLLERAANFFGFLTIAIWWSAVGYTMSWSGHRPLQPDPASGRIYPFNNHGIMYVTAQDIFWWHLGLYTAFALAAVTAACYYGAKYLRRPQL